MDKNLNNWFDKVEGLPENYSNYNIVKELKRQGYTCKMYTDNKGEQFIGWDKEDACDEYKDELAEIIDSTQD